MAFQERIGAPVDLIRPHFTQPVNAAPPIAAVPVAFTTNDDDDDDLPDLPTLTPGQKLGLAALVVGGLLAGVGRGSPSTTYRIIRFGGKSLFGMGNVTLITQGGHGPDSAGVPPHPLPNRPGPPPVEPTPPPPSKWPPPSIGQSIVMGVYREGYLAAMRGRVPNGTGLAFVDFVMRLIGPVKIGKPVVDGDADPLAGGFRTIFGGMGDVMGNKPGGIVNNLTREGVGQHIGNGITLVAQTADP